MVQLTLPLVVLAMTAASVAAAPAATFSFENWVEDIIANPDTALTVDEAIAAASAADVIGSAGGLQKRAWCRADVKQAPVCLSLRQSQVPTYELIWLVCIGTGCCGLRR
jgi:hypothetical protein